MTDVEQLYEESRKTLMGYFVRRHRSVQIAEDLLQETFARVMRQAPRAHASHSPRGYLFGIARHVSIDAWRRNQPVTGDERVLHTLAAPEADERLAAASEIIAALPALQREILELRFQHDLAYAEMAEALGIPVGTVRSRLHHALGLLRQKLNNEEEGINL